MKTKTRSGVTGSLLIAMVLTAALTIVGCTSGTDGKKGSVKDNITQTLMSRTWVGKIMDQPIVLTFMKENNVLTAEMMYTHFTKPNVKEILSVDISDSGLISMKGMSYKRVGGYGSFGLDTLTGKLSADTVTITGTARDIAHPESGAWSVSSKQKIEDVDFPIDMKKAETSLFTGKWEGVVGKKPASIRFAEKKGNLTAQIKVAKTTTNLTVELKDDGSVLMKSQPKPSGGGLVSEIYQGTLYQNYATIIGEYEHITKSGFTESSYTEIWGFENKKK